MKVQGERRSPQHGPIKFPPMTSPHSSPDEQTKAALTCERVGVSESRTTSSAGQPLTARHRHDITQRSPLCFHSPH